MTMNSQREAPEALYLEFTLGDRLSRSLRHAGLGVGEMAEILGVGRETAGRWMHDHNQPKRAALMAWSAITNVSLHWLEAGCSEAHASEEEARACLRARRDSNPKPSDWEPALYRAADRWGCAGLVNGGLTSNWRAEIGPMVMRAVGQ